MTPPKIHVNGSIQAINDNSCVLGGKLLLSRQPGPSPDQPSWRDSSGGFFVLSEVSSPLPPCRPHPEDSATIPLVYSAGDQSAVWRVGEAFLEVRDRRYPNVTHEHVTLEYLHEKKPLSFEIPDVIYHGEWVGRYYLILSRVPGQTLTTAWPGMDEELRQYHVDRVAQACAEMAEWEGSAVCGVDGRELMEFYLTNSDSMDPGELCENCVKMGMDVSSLVFYHCDLGPGNIIVDPDTRGLGIIDWEIAGYFPREWVRTKFHLSSGMDFPDVEDADAKVDLLDTQQRNRTKVTISM